MTPSPCRQVCKYDLVAGFCRGCGRSSAEISEWTKASEARKAQIVMAAAERLNARSED